MFFHAIQQGEWNYRGHEQEKGRTMDEAIKYLNECHEITMKGLNQLPEEDFMNKVKTFNGYKVSCWRLVLAMTEHEIHHRGQLSAYLQMNCIDPPQIFGLKIEQINGE